jgi:alkenylglycerophosphocholine/alkenylglycerophosphoethanolamine hydrolase
MFTSLFAAAAVGFAVLAIAADWNERRRHDSFYLLKPLTTLMIIGLAASAPSSEMRTLMLLALSLSLVGDICLMFDGQIWFMGGLGSFLLAHLAFIPALLHGVTAPTLPLWSAAIVVWGLACFAWLLPKAGSLKPAVLVYGVVLMAMALAAVARWTALPSNASLLALAGALLFVVSDSSLAIRQFVGRYRAAQALILSTYWAAIGLMAFSLTLA